MLENGHVTIPCLKPTQYPMLYDDLCQTSRGSGRGTDHWHRAGVPSGFHVPHPAGPVSLYPTGTQEDRLVQRDAETERGPGLCQSHVY